MPEPNEKLTIYITPELAQRIRTAAVQERITYSELCERILAEHCPSYTVRQKPR